MVKNIEEIQRARELYKELEAGNSFELGSEIANRNFIIEEKLVELKH